MRLPSVRFRIWWPMAAVAALALPLAWLDLVDVAALAGMAIVGLIPVACAPSGHRLKVALWVAAVHPATALAYLYATWVTAWCVLGHSPRSSLDDPNLISPLVDVPYVMTFFSILLCPVCLPAGFALTLGPFLRRESAGYPAVILPSLWLVAFLALVSDPFGVFEWFVD